MAEGLTNAGIAQRLYLSERTIEAHARHVIVLGLQARARLAGAEGTRTATVAAGLAALAVLSVVFFLIVGPPD